MERTPSENASARFAGLAADRVAPASPAFFFLPSPVDSTASVRASAGVPADAPLLSN
jgi:hypothetical protein